MEKIEYTCKWCGTSSYDLDDFEIDFQRQRGFWCPDCDGFTYFEGKEEVQSYNLILEDKSNTEISVIKKAKFNKRLSPLRYPGGKSKLIDYLYQMMRPEKEVFVEVFCGGASVGLSLLEAGKIKKLILNDLDYGIYSLFYQILNEPEILISQIKSYVPSREDFFQKRKIIENDYKMIDKKDAAFAFLVVNRMAHSGIVKANPKGNLTERWNIIALESRIRKIYSLRKQIQLFQLSATELIQEYYWLENATLFLDPPYYKKGKDLYHLFFTKEQHEEISELLNTLVVDFPGCADILITYDNEIFIKELYPISNVNEIGRIFSIAN